MWAALPSSRLCPDHGSEEIQPDHNTHLRMRRICRGAWYLSRSRQRSDCRCLPFSFAALRLIPGPAVQVHGERSLPFPRTRLRLRLPRRLRLRSAFCNGRGPRVPCLRSTPPETCSVSLMLFLSAPAVGRKRFASQLVGGDHKHAVRFGIHNIDYTQIPSRTRQAQRNSGTLSTRAVFTGLFQNVDYLVFTGMVIVNVRSPGNRIDVESDRQTYLQSHSSARRQTDAKSSAPLAQFRQWANRITHVQGRSNQQSARSRQYPGRRRPRVTAKISTRPGKRG